MIKSASHGSLVDAVSTGHRRSYSGYLHCQQAHATLFKSQSAQQLFKEVAQTKRKCSCPPCTALPIVPSMWAELGSAFQNEIELESSLHVTALAAAQCEAAFGPAQIVPKAPAIDAGLPSSPTVLEIQQTRSLAACLATPSEAAETAESEVLHEFRNRALQSGFREAAAYQLQENVITNVDRWGDWARRIRRKRRKEQFQALLAMLLEAPSPFASYDRE